MCDFVSWIEYDKEVYFLQNKDLDTKEGKKLLLPEYKDDICGHGAIRHYYPELKNRGLNKECTDFSTPDNFPKEIVKVLKQGELSRFGICLELLTKPAKAEYNKIRKLASAEYYKIINQAWEEYDKIVNQAWAIIVKQKRNRINVWK